MRLARLQEAVKRFDFFVVDQEWNIVLGLDWLDDLYEATALFRLDLLVRYGHTLLELRLILVLHSLEIEAIVPAVLLFAKDGLRRV